MVQTSNVRRFSEPSVRLEHVIVCNHSTAVFCCFKILLFVAHQTSVEAKNSGGKLAKMSKFSIFSIIVLFYGYSHICHAGIEPEPGGSIVDPKRDQMLQPSVRTTTEEIIYFITTPDTDLERPASTPSW